jgi:hypothetical protein
MFEGRRNREVKRIGVIREGSLLWVRNEANFKRGRVASQGERVLQENPISKTITAYDSVSLWGKLV